VIDYVVGVDGGNSKTDVVLATTDGDVLARVRGVGTRAYFEGMTTTVDNVTELILRAKTEAGLEADTPIAVAAYFLANLDTPADEAAFAAQIAEKRNAGTEVVHNDTFAILHAGAPDGWGVAVVCGAGINATGLHHDGRIARFLALGPMTGDWGGGEGVAMAGLGDAVRAGDGRGPQTLLRAAMAEHFGMQVEDVAMAVLDGRLKGDDLHAAAPVVFAAAVAGDAVATAIVDRLAEEIATMIVAHVRSLDLLGEEVPVVLGGGTLQHGPSLLIDAIDRRLADRVPLARTRVLDVPPVTGAVLHALALAGAGAAARSRVRDGFRLASSGVTDD
jgi:N-acetylglucosamine kinase-like BadF-type ATPase